MGIEGDIVQEPVVVEGEGESAKKDYNPTNPVFEVKKDEALVDKKPEEPQQEEPEKKDDPVPKGVQKRIDRAVREKYEAQARAKMLEERLAAIEGRLSQNVQPQHRQLDNSEPKIENFSDFDSYVAAKAEWVAAKKIEETLTEREKRIQAERVAESRRSVEESWSQKIAAATAEMPDFEEVISSSDVPMSDLMRDAIIESEVGPKVAYWLANNPDEAAKIARMSPLATVAAIGRIEERIASQEKAPKKATGAPPPVKPVGSRASVTRDPGQMTDAEYAEWRKKGKAA